MKQFQAPSATTKSSSDGTRAAATTLPPLVRVTDSMPSHMAHREAAKSAATKKNTPGNSQIRKNVGRFDYGGVLKVSCRKPFISGARKIGGEGTQRMLIDTTACAIFSATGWETVESGDEFNY